VPPLPAPTGLPVEDCVAGLRVALAGAGLAVLRAPPGAGKTTVVPLRLLDEPWLAGGRIVVLEPRRLATRAAARRMAALLGEEVGATVGYRTRDDRRVGPATRVEVVTEGILTRRLQDDPSLPGVGLVVLDELHERSLHADLALALLLDARPALRPDLRVLAMSATLETDRVAALLGGPDGPAPVVASEGRAHPVDVRWIPPPPRRRLAESAAAAVLRALREEPGDVLTFLPGAADIRRVEALLRADDGSLPAGLRGPGAMDGVDVRPLFGALPVAAQDEALAASPPGRRRVVLATDIAETSLTVEGVRVVVDAGQARTPRYDPRSGLTRLHTGPASKASADQRAGRAGRTGPGVAYRLWSKLEHAARRPFAAPEITSVDLAGLVLEVAVWGAEVSRLRWLDPPPARALAEARELLGQLGALDGDGRPTPAGRAMAELPLHPRLARMVAAAGPLNLACALAALLEDRDVLRGAPEELPVDVAERVRVILDPSASHPRLDRQATAGARRRAGELARRAGSTGLRGPNAPTGLRGPNAPTGLRGPNAPPDQAGCGPVLALAYPDRIAQARGGGRFRLRGGGGAWVPAADPLATEPFLVVAELDADRGDSRIRVAAALDAADLEAAAGAAVERSTTLGWDTGRDDLRARVERRLGALVLSAAEAPPEPGPVTTRALLERVRATRLGVLGWTDDARALQGRAAFARRVLDDGWPDLADAALLASLDDWLAPVLATATATGRADLEAVDLARALRSRLGHARAAELDRAAPPTLMLAGGRRVAVDYEGDQPAVAVRVQDLFGTTTHPTVAGGRVPVVLHLLSPAGRPVQVTTDLPGFWAGSWAAVRKEMAGRYPKHPWPADPATAPVPARRGRAGRSGHAGRR